MLRFENRGANPKWLGFLDSSRVEEEVDYKLEKCEHVSENVSG